MKKAFLLIELVLSIVVLAVIFSSFSLYYKQIHKNYEPLKLLQDLYLLEEKLSQNSKLRIFELRIPGLNPLFVGEEMVSNGVFELKNLRILDQNYSVYFR